MSATGGIAFVTQSGPVDLILDITATSFRAPMSTQDAQGVDGPRGLSAWDTIPSGQTVTDNWGTSNQYSAAFGIISFSVPLPAKASTALTAAQVNFAPGTPSRPISTRRVPGRPQRRPLRPARSAPLSTGRRWVMRPASKAL